MALSAVRPVRTEEQYDEYLREIDRLVIESSQAARDELEVLIILVKEYERRHHPMLPPDPVEAIKFYMELKGLEPSDLQHYIGPRQRVHDVLHGKRRLSMAMIQRLHEGLGIPAETLLGRYEDSKREPTRIARSAPGRSGRPPEVRAS